MHIHVNMHWGEVDLRVAHALHWGFSEGYVGRALGGGEGFARALVAAVLVMVLISPSAAVTESQPCEMHSLSACLSLYVCACLLLLRAHSSAARESLR